MDWHALTAAETAARLRTDPARGLSEAEAARRLAEDGPNVLGGGGGKSAWTILLDQLKSAMIALLVAAAFLSALLGDVLDASAIAAILLLNVGLGFAQEYRADRSLAELKKLAEPRCRALRAGRPRSLDPAKLVAGDVMLLEAGARVPADGRLIEAASLRVEESSLTGESVPVDKGVEPVAGTPPLGDRTGMVYSSTRVVAGRGRALVTATGPRAELGRIASSIRDVVEGPTPLQRRLERVARQLAGAALLIVLVFLTAGLLRGEPWRLMLMTSVGMAVAAVPEGLPAVIVATLAIAARRMLARNALVRKLTAVEALGSVTVICSDKTGTLTRNEMTVAAVEPLDEGDGPLLLAAGALCGDAALVEEAGPPRAHGDPTETAIVLAALEAGLAKHALDAAFPRTAEKPFDSARKRMSTTHAVNEAAAARLPAGRAREELAGAGGFVAAKGSAAAMLEASGPLDEERRRRLLETEERLAARGMRVLAVGWRPLDDAPEAERGLRLLGLLGLVDPPRDSAKAAVAACRAAGIKIVMITGDHPLTARAVAAELGLPPDAQIHARVSPERKLEIVEELQRRGEIVAMTGDGVNDAPALKKADVGVAMGGSGTDVAKEASSIVLLDDDFATIVAAVREGRVVYDNVRKFLKFLMTTNAAELALMLAGPLFGMPLPLTPIQILWVNLLTDGLPALALGFEAAEPDVMERPPRPPSEPLFDRRMVSHIVWAGALMAGLALAAGGLAWRAENPHWRSILLMTVVAMQLAHALAIRSHRPLSLRSGAPANVRLWAAAAVTAALQALVLYAPSLQPVFATQPLTAAELLWPALCALAVYVAVEVEKRCIMRV